MTDKNIPHVGERIKDIRRVLRISQKDFAEKLNISGSFLSEVEAGKCKPGFEFLSSITHNFSVNPLYLITASGDKFLTKKPRNLVILDDDYGEFSPIVREMLVYFKRSPLVKMAVLEFFKRYIHQNKEMIEDNLKEEPEPDQPVYQLHQ